MKKKKMNSYLKCIAILVTSGLVGGVIGFLAGLTEDAGWWELIRDGLNSAMLWIRANMIPLLVICAAVSILLCELFFHRVKKAGMQLESAEDEEIDRLEYQMEVDESWGTIVNISGRILMILILSSSYVHDFIENLEGQDAAEFFGAIVVFVIGMLYLALWNVRYIKLVQKIYPEKKGDPASRNFQKQWLESCDEAEKEQIYEASYKTFLFLNTCFPIVTCLAMICQMLWSTGFLAIVIPAVMWLATTAYYCRCCIRKRAEKWN